MGFLLNSLLIVVVRPIFVIVWVIFLLFGIIFIDVIWAFIYLVFFCFFFYTISTYGIHF